MNDNQCKNSQHSEESKTRFCKEGKCGGYDKGESCKSNDYCLSGLYCNKNNICKEQMSSGVCQNSYQCKIYFLNNTYNSLYQNHIRVYS